MKKIKYTIKLFFAAILIASAGFIGGKEYEKRNTPSIKIVKQTKTKYKVRRDPALCLNIPLEITGQMSNNIMHVMCTDTCKFAEKEFTLKSQTDRFSIGLGITAGYGITTGGHGVGVMCGVSFSYNFFGF